MDRDSLGEAARRDEQGRGSVLVVPGDSRRPRDDGLGVALPQRGDDRGAARRSRRQRSPAGTVICVDEQPIAVEPRLAAAPRVVRSKSEHADGWPPPPI